MFRRTKQKNSRTTQQPQRMLWRQLLVGTGLVLLTGLIGTGVWHLTRMEVFTITNTEVVGGVTIATDQIETIANTELIGAYYRLIPKRFTYLYPEARIEDQVRALERVKNVDVTRSDRHTLVVVFEEYEPYALWCEEIKSSNCLFIDRNGYAFTAAPELSGGAFVRFVSPDLEPTIGQSIATAEIVRGSQSFVTTVYEQLELNIVAITVDNDDVVYQVAGGGEIRTSATMPYADALANLESILTSSEFAHLGPGLFSYIDLRFGDKIFVNEGLEEAATSTAETTDIIETEAVE